MNELKYSVLTSQVTNFFIEIILPYLLQARAVWVKRIQPITIKDGIRNEDESAFLKRIRKEAKLPVYIIQLNAFSLASLIVEMALIFVLNIFS